MFWTFVDTFTDCAALNSNENNGIYVPDGITQSQRCYYISFLQISFFAARTDCLNRCVHM